MALDLILTELTERTGSGPATGICVVTLTTLVRRPVDAVRINHVPVKMIRDLEAGAIHAGKAVDAADIGISDEHRQFLGRELLRVPQTLPPEGLAPYVERQPQVLKGAASPRARGDDCGVSFNAPGR